MFKKHIPSTSQNQYFTIYFKCHFFLLDLIPDKSTFAYILTFNNFFFHFSPILLHFCSVIVHFVQAE